MAYAHENNNNSTYYEAADDHDALLSILSGCSEGIQTFFDKYFDDPVASAQWVETAICTLDRYKLQQEPYALGFRLAFAGDVEARARFEQVRRRMGWSDADKHEFIKAVDPERKLKPITIKVPDDLGADDLKSYLMSYTVSPYDLIDHKPLQRQLIVYWKDPKGKAALQDYVRGTTSYDNYTTFQTAMDALAIELEGRFVEGGQALSALMEAPAAPLSFVCRRLMRQSGLTILAGRPKVGKSTLALQYMLAVASGTSFLDFFSIDSPGRVLYLAFEEEPQEIVHHVRGLLEGKADCTPNIYLPRLESSAPVQVGAPFFAQLDAWRLQDGDPARLIVIDVLTHVLPTAKRSGNAYEQDYSRLKPLIDYAQDTNVHILAITHLSKSYKQTQDVELAIMGSTGISASATSLWVLLADDSEKGYAQLHVSGRGLPQDDFCLVRQTSGHTLAFALDVKVETTSPERLAILSEMYAYCPHVYTVQKLAQVLDHERSSCSRMLRRMADADLVNNVRGNYHLTPRGYRIAENHAAKLDAQRRLS